MNLSPNVIVGKKFVSTVAFSGCSGPKGIKGRGGHQHVHCLILIGYMGGGPAHPMTQ